MGDRRVKSSVLRVTLLEVFFALMLAVGVGLIVGSFDTGAGVGAGLIAGAVCGFVFILAYERGSR